MRGWMGSLGTPFAALAVVLCAVVVAACGGSTKTVTVVSPSGSQASRPLARSRITRADVARYAVLVGAGIDLLNKNNPGAAEQLFTQATAKEPTSPIAYFDLGLAWQRLDQLQDARRGYRQALLRAPDYVPALYNLALIAVPAMKRNLYQRLALLRPQSAQVQLGLGLALFSADGPTVAAVHALHRAVALDPALVKQIPAQVRSKAGLG